MCPELGGHESLLDIVGFNYYYDNQWQLHPHRHLGWNDPEMDPRWVPLSELLAQAHKRYKRPFVVTETSHPGEDRPLWWQMIGRECAQTLRKGLPLLGACIYPMVDRPDWDHLDQWHRSGLWDAELRPDGPPRRLLHEPSAVALREAQAMVQQAQHSPPKARRRSALVS